MALVSGGAGGGNFFFFSLSFIPDEAKTERALFVTDICSVCVCERRTGINTLPNIRRGTAARQNCLVCVCVCVNAEKVCECARAFCVCVRVCGRRQQCAFLLALWLRVCARSPARPPACEKEAEGGKSVEGLEVECQTGEEEGEICYIWSPACHIFTAF